MRFLQTRHHDEWAELIDRGGLVVPVATLVDAVSVAFTGRDALVTDIYRTAEEQNGLCDELGLDQYRSVHEFWRGVDFRSFDWTLEQAADIVGHVNRVFHYGGLYVVAKIHVKGTAAHLHCQVPPASRANTWTGARR